MPKPIDQLSERELFKLYDKRMAVHSAVNQKLIDAGYGYERFSDTIARAKTTNDPLAVEFLTTWEAFIEVSDEKAARWRYQGSYKPIKRRS